jgi:hypothetical protein
MSSPRTRRLLASVVESVFHRGQIPQSLATRFSDDLAVTLDAFSLASHSGNAELPRAQMALNWLDATYTANVQLTTEHNGVLENGWYDGIWSDEALPLATEHRTSFRFVLGDFDDDGAVSNQDIALFMDLLSGAATPPGVGPAVGDMNRDGVVNNQDINPFVGALTFGVRLPDPLAAPGQIATWALSDTSLRVNWTAPAEGVPDGYRVYRSSDGTNFQLVADLSEPALQPGGYFWDDAGLGQGTKYWYRVRPYTLAAGNGHTTDRSWSCTVLPAPTDVSAETGDTLTRITWTDQSDGESGWTIRVLDAGGSQVLQTVTISPADAEAGNAGTLRSWTLGGLLPETAYQVQVTAVKSGVISAPQTLAEVQTEPAAAAPPGTQFHVWVRGAVPGSSVAVEVLEEPSQTADGRYGNGTLHLRFTNLPRHTAAKLYSYAVTDDGGGYGFTMEFAGRSTGPIASKPLGSATLWRNTEPAGNPASGWIEHVETASLDFTLTASGFGSDRGWSHGDMQIELGIPFVGLRATDGLGGEDPGEIGTDPQTGAPIYSDGPDPLGYEAYAKGPLVKPVRFSSELLAPEDPILAAATAGDFTGSPARSFTFEGEMPPAVAVEAVPQDDDETEPMEWANVGIAGATAAGQILGHFLVEAPATGPLVLFDNDATYEIKQVSVSFADQGIKRDTGEQKRYDDAGVAEWFDKNGDGKVSGAGEREGWQAAPDADHSYPVSFTRGGTVSAGVVFTIQVHEDVADPDAFVSSLWISGEGGGVGELTGRFEGQTSWSPVPDKPRQYHVWLSATASNAEGRLAPLGEKIDAGKLETRWRLSRLKGAENKPVSSERSAVNRAYVTGAAAPDAFHTVVDIGCEGGIGRSPATDAGKADVLKGVWGEFSDRKVERAWDDRVMKYWGKDLAPNPMGTTAFLLSTANATCGAWAHFLYETLVTQGVSGANVYGVFPPTIPPPAEVPLDGLEAKGNTLMVHPGPGQGMAQPQSACFTNHAVVKVGQRVYDASYGGPSYESELHWEQQAVAGMATVYERKAPAEIFAVGFGGVDKYFVNPESLDTSWQVLR